MSSSYLNMSFVWKSMVASYMFVHVADVGMRVFNTFISSTKLFVSSKKCVCIQRLNCSFPARNVFVCSVILYSEVSSRDYLVSSDKRISLQFDIIFKGE